jgi:hypothetical protein
LEWFLGQTYIGCISRVLDGLFAAVLADPPMIDQKIAICAISFRFISCASLSKLGA